MNDPVANAMRRARRAAFRLGHWLNRFRCRKGDNLTYAAECRWCGAAVLLCADWGWKAHGDPMTRTCRAVS